MKKHTITKFLVLLLVLAMALPCLPAVVSAEETESFATQLEDYANKTEFVINTKDDLKAFMTAGKPFDGKTVKLGADIVWNEGTANTNGTFTMADETAAVDYWTPITTTFGGDTGVVFDGQGHTISGLAMKVTSSSSLNNGFFKAIKNATIKNIIFDNCAFVTDKGAQDYPGFLAGKAWGSNTFTNVHINAYQVHSVHRTSSTSGGSVGGMVGLLASSSSTNTFTNCTVSGVVNGSYAYYVGGFVGSTASNSANVVMTDCINYASVKANNYVAGFVGKQAGIGTFTRCTSLGSVSATTYGEADAGHAEHSASITVLKIVDTYKAALDVSFVNCYHSTASNTSAVTIDITSQRFKVTVDGFVKDYRSTELTVSEIEKELTENFKAFTKGTSMAINIYGVQQNADKTKARFISTFKTNSDVNESNIVSISFEITPLGGNSISKTCPAVYKSILATTESGTIKNIKVGEGEFANVDYLATCVLEDIPTNADSVVTLIVSSYMTTKNGTRIDNNTNGSLILTISGGNIVGIAHTL